LLRKIETLTFNVGDISDDSKTAKVQLTWENTSVKFGVAVDYDAKVMKSIEASTKVNPGNYFQAAVYYLENGKDLKQAHEWIAKAADASPKAFWIYYQKPGLKKHWETRQAHWRPQRNPGRRLPPLKIAIM